MFVVSDFCCDGHVYFFVTYHWSERLNQKHSSIEMSSKFSVGRENLCSSSRWFKFCFKIKFCCEATILHFIKKKIAEVSG